MRSYPHAGVAGRGMRTSNRLDYDHIPVESFPIHLICSLSGDMVCNRDGSSILLPDDSEEISGQSVKKTEEQKEDAEEAVQNMHCLLYIHHGIL